MLLAISGPTGSDSRWSFKSGIIPNTALYLHRISDTRITGSDLSNFGSALCVQCSPVSLERLEIYRSLLGDQILGNTVFVTTHWPKVEGESLEDARRREDELKTDRLFMRQFLDKGARIERFEGSRVSALKLINLIPYKELSARIPLQVQTELIVEEKALQITQAGRRVAEGVLDMMRAYEQGQRDQHAITESLANAQDNRSIALRERALSDAAVLTKLLEQIREALRHNTTTKDDGNNLISPKERIVL